MGKLIYIAVMLVAMPVGDTWAAVACRPIEYSELKDLSKKELIAEFCIAKRLSDKLLNQRERLPDAAYFADLDSCLSQRKRIERLLEKKKIKEPSCPDPEDSK